MADNNKTILETDDDARALARTLVSQARFGSLAVLLPDCGDPFASRVAVGCDHDRTPVILVSQLSRHTRGLDQDPRVSLLLGEPGKGDPLAHPRITLQCLAERIYGSDARRPLLRDRFLRRHPKSALYADFADFAFFRLNPRSASLNGGFGKAYDLESSDLLIDTPAIDGISQMEESAIAHMAKDHADAIALYAEVLAGEAPGRWSICGIDAAGFDLLCGDRLRRIEFDEPLQEAAQLSGEMAALARHARQIRPDSASDSG